jgi:hypothetical protein
MKWPDAPYCVTAIKHGDQDAALDAIDAWMSDDPPLSGDATTAKYEGSTQDSIRLTKQGDWLLLIELHSAHGVDFPTVAKLSKGTEVVSLYYSSVSHDLMIYAVDGEITTMVDPVLPDSRWGSDPDALLEDMQEAGFFEEGKLPDAAALDMVRNVWGLDYSPELVFTKKLPVAIHE